MVFILLRFCQKYCLGWNSKYCLFSSEAWKRVNLEMGSKPTAAGELTSSGVRWRNKLTTWCFRAATARWIGCSDRWKWGDSYVLCARLHATGMDCFQGTVEKKGRECQGEKRWWLRGRERGVEKEGMVGEMRVRIKGLPDYSLWLLAIFEFSFSSQLSPQSLFATDNRSQVNLNLVNSITLPF